MVLAERAAAPTDHEGNENILPPHWTTIVNPVIEIHPIDYRYILDLSATHASISEILVDRAQHVTFANTDPENLQSRRQKFGSHPKFSYVQMESASLKSIPEQSISFFITFDWMVQFDLELIQSYLREAFSVMKPGAMGFFHYSNYLLAPGATLRLNPHARGFMSKPVFEHCALKSGFSIIHSATISWGGVPDLDGIALLRKPLAAWRP